MRVFVLRILYIPLITALVILGMGCAAKEPQTIHISGSTTIEPFMKRITEEYRNRRNVSFTISAIGSQNGIDELIAGTCDIAMSSAEISAQHRAQAEEKGLELKSFFLGYDIIVPIVNKRNPLSDISLEQLRTVFSRTIVNWSALGGPDAPLQVISRDTCSGTFCEWNRIVIGHAVACEKETSQPSNSSSLHYVAASENAIGYVSYAYLNPEVKPLQVNGLRFSDRETLVKEYPVKRPLYLYVNEQRFRGAIKRFITYVLMNESAETLFRESGFFPEFYVKNMTVPGD